MKLSNIFPFISMVLSIVVTSACREDEPELLRADEMIVYSKPSEQFDAVWKSINQNYVFWDVDSTDWDAVYSEYMPRFLELDERSSITNDELRELYEGATGTLIDHHMSLLIYNLWGDGAERNSGIMISPSKLEVQKRPYFHNFNGYGVCEAYEHLLSGTNVSNLKFGLHNDNYFCTAIIDDHVLYFGLSNFKITPLMSDASVPEPQRDDYDNDELFEEDHSNWLAMQNAKDVVDTYLHNALDNPAITDVVFDLRGNIGGYLMDNFYLLGLFLEQPTVAIYTHHKSGIGRYDYSPWIPQVFYPYERTRKLSGKIVVLCDLYSISMAEISGLLAKIMPNAYLMGERTYGAQGVLNNDFNLFYSGSFGSVDGPHYGYMCDQCTRTVDGAFLEGKGVTPDITLDYNYDECYGDNRDAWLDRAIEFIATGR